MRSLRRIETFSVDDVEFSRILKPYTFGAPFAILESVEYWKMGVEGIIHEGAFAGALGSKDSDGGEGVGE